MQTKTERTDIGWINKVGSQDHLHEKAGHVIETKKKLDL